MNGCFFGVRVATRWFYELYADETFGLNLLTIIINEGSTNATLTLHGGSPSPGRVREWLVNEFPAIKWPADLRAAVTQIVTISEADHVMLRMRTTFA